MTGDDVKRKVREALTLALDEIDVTRNYRNVLSADDALAPCIVLTAEEAKEAVWAIEVGPAVNPESPAQARIDACVALLTLNQPDPVIPGYGSSI
jgi:hypothetical protein